MLGRTVHGIVLTLIFCTAISIPVTISAPVYDPWLDINDDGKVDLKDYYAVGKAYGSSGTPLQKASVAYDSGWMDISGKRDQFFRVVHNLGIPDWSDPSLMVDITGKTSLGDTETLRPTGMDYPAWDRTFGGINTDAGYSIIQTTEGGFAVAGFTYSSVAQGYDAYLIKTDGEGNLEWSKTYGGANSDIFKSLVQTSDGYALAGLTESSGAGGEDVYLVKTDSSGNLVWSKTWGGENNDYALSIIQTSGGGYALAGCTASFGAGGLDAYLITTDSSGNGGWSQTYGGMEHDRAFCVVETSGGGYALAGDTESSGEGWSDFYLVKTDSSGNVEWSKTYGGTGIDTAYSLVQTTGGGYALGGATGSFGVPGGQDFYLVKTDGSGDLEWSKNFGGAGEDFAYDMAQTSSGGYVLAGCTTSMGAGLHDFYLVETDSLGNEEWWTVIGSPGDEWCSSVVPVAPVLGGSMFAMVGYKAPSALDPNWDCWLVELGRVPKLCVACVEWNANSLTFYRYATDVEWNYLRVQIIKRR